MEGTKDGVSDAELGNTVGSELGAIDGDTEGCILGAVDGDDDGFVLGSVLEDIAFDSEMGPIYVARI